MFSQKLFNESRANASVADEDENLPEPVFDAYAQDQTTTVVASSIY